MDGYVITLPSRSLSQLIKKLKIEKKTQFRLLYKMNYYKKLFYVD